MDLTKRISVTLMLAALVAFSWFSPLDLVATQQVDAGLKRALVSFATARTLNAVISAAQGTEVAIQPLGVGVNLAPGQILDPINDLVEQFSQLMLMASVSFGVQKVLISMGGHWLVTSCFALVALSWSVFYLFRFTMPVWLPKLLLIAVMLRLAVPAVTVGTDALFQHFLAQEYTNSQSFIEAGAEDAKKLNPPDKLPPVSKGLLDYLKAWVPQDLNIGASTDRFMKAAEQWPEKIINLMVIFLLQTLLLPMVLLWGLVTFAKSILDAPSTAPPNREKFESNGR